MWVNVSFQIMPRPVGRLELELGLESGPHVVRRLGSGPRVVGSLGSRVCINASFQVFALTAGGMS